MLHCSTANALKGNFAGGKGGTETSGTDHRDAQRLASPQLAKQRLDVVEPAQQSWS